MPTNFKTDEGQELHVITPEEVAFNVRNWCPSPEPTIPPTQVHLAIHMGPEELFVIRFHGPRSLDALIEALTLHRREVFGEPDPTAPTAITRGEA